MSSAEGPTDALSCSASNSHAVLVEELARTREALNYILAAAMIAGQGACQHEPGEYDAMQFPSCRLCLLHRIVRRAEATLGR